MSSTTIGNVQAALIKKKIFLVDQEIQKGAVI
jgi:hypothetical protein